MFVNRFLVCSVVTIFAAAFWCGAPVANAQDVGGSLGGSFGVFRPNSPKPATKAKPKSNKTNAAKVRVVKPKSAPKPVTVARVRKPAPRPKTKNPKIINVEPDNRAPDTLEGLIAEGNAARDERNFLGAQDAYERAAVLNPRDARAAYGLGNIYTDQQRWDEAEKAYRESLKIDPNQVEANIALSYVLMQPNRGGDIAQRYTEAENAARRAIDMDSNVAMAHDQLGIALESRGVLTAETEAAFRRAIKIDSNFALPYAHLGRFLNKKGKKGDAQENYNKAVTLADDVPTIILVAEVLQSERKFEDSETLLQKALRMDDGNPTVLFLIGRAFIVSGKMEEAEAALVKSVRISPRSFATYNSLGALYLRMERVAEAEKIYLQALTYAAESERRQLAGNFGFAGVGDGYLRKNQKNDALRAYRQGLEIDANNLELNTKIKAASN